MFIKLFQPTEKYVDEVMENGTLTIDKEDISNLTQIFNRGGSSSHGYYDTYSSLNMLSKSPKSSGVEIGVVTGYNPKNKRCSIKLSRPVTAGDGIRNMVKTAHRYRCKSNSRCWQYNFRCCRRLYTKRRQSFQIL